MRKKRILIVDDSVVIRRYLAESLRLDSGMEVAGSAPNGRIALMKIPLLCPDVIALDIDMPEMSGLETLAAILKSYPHLTVIILNVPTESGAAATLDALTLGARDYVTKPDTSGNFDHALRLLSDDFISKVALHCPSDFHQRSLVQTLTAVPNDETSGYAYATRQATRVDVVAIGVSTGGPNALMDLIPQFPSDFPVPILIVQHMPPIFTKFLAERLAAKCKIRIGEGISHQILLPGTAWIAPGDFHMTLEREGEVVRIRTYKGPLENSLSACCGRFLFSVCRPNLRRSCSGGCDDGHGARRIPRMPADFQRGRPGARPR